MEELDHHRLIQSHFDPRPGDDGLGRIVAHGGDHGIDRHDAADHERDHRQPEQCQEDTAEKAGQIFYPRVQAFAIPA